MLSLWFLSGSGRETPKHDSVLLLELIDEPAPHGLSGRTSGRWGLGRIVRVVPAEGGN